MSKKVKIIVREAAATDSGAVVSIIEAADNLSTEEKDCAVELLEMYFVELGELVELDECSGAPKEDTCPEGRNVESLSVESEDDYLVLVAEIESKGEDNLLAGYICYGPASFAGGVSEIYWIVVGAEYKGQGAATALVEHIEGILKETGLRMIVAETSGLASYEAARAFYKKVGFVEEARIEGFFKAGDDKVFFVKRY